MAVSAPSDRRFRRARVSPTKKRRLLSRASVYGLLRVMVVLGFVFYGAYRGAELALSAEALTVTRITVEGNTRMSRGEVLALLDGLNGLNLVMMDLEPWRQRLRTSPWVADAAIRRVLPGTLAVLIVERQPVAIGRLGNQLFLLDQRANVIDEFGPVYAEFDLPIIDGLTGDGPGDLAINPARAGLAMQLLASLEARPDLMTHVSQIDVSDVRDAALILKDDTTLVRIGDQQFVERLQSYLDLRPTLRERISDIDSVDLRFDDRLYVKPRGQVRSAVRTTSER